VKINYINIFKYSSVGFIIFIILHFMKNILNYEQALLEFMPSFIFLIILGGCSYFVITFTIDKNSRNLFYEIINEVKRLIK